MGGKLGGLARRRAVGGELGRTLLVVERRTTGVSASLGVARHAVGSAVLLAILITQIGAGCRVRLHELLECDPLRSRIVSFH